VFHDAAESAANEHGVALGNAAAQLKGQIRE
jgi:hypothetical protein